MHFEVFRKRVIPIKGRMCFYVTKYYHESKGSEEYTESSLEEIYMSVGTEVEITDGIRSIALIAMYIDPECDSEWSSMEYLDYSHDKNMYQ